MEGTSAGNGSEGSGAGSAVPAPADRVSGTLTLAAVPIGRPEDGSPRLAAALGSAPVVAAEDTRRVRRLASALGVQLAGTVISYYDEVEISRTPRLLAELEAGHDVLLVTDAGMPGVSDPGYRLTAAAAAAGIRVTVLPGPSAVTTALAVSGLPSDRFCFEGFPPRRPGERARSFAELAAEPRTLIFFESPRRLATTLSGLAEAFGAGRAAVVCRELTKTHEEIVRGSLAELAQWAAPGPLGEITIVVAGAPARRDAAQAGVTAEEMAKAIAAVAARQETGTSRRDAIAAVASEQGLPRRTVYEAVVRQPRTRGDGDRCER
jgi:16S rRNA (cytidine1402-2'-O)-methyltransferase